MNGCISPFSEKQLNPASYNLRIGENALVETRSGMEKVKLTNGFHLAPGGWILCDVLEAIRVPPNLEAQVILRSSAARRGWDHALAGYVDPGYQGVLTLEFQNCLRFQHLELRTGMELVQLKYSRLTTVPSKDYAATGRYFGATHVEGNKDATI